MNKEKKSKDDFYYNEDIPSPALLGLMIVEFPLLMKTIKNKVKNIIFKK